MNNASLVYKVVDDRIGILNANDAWSKANLAKLRRGSGKDIASSPDTWEMVLGNLPYQLKGIDSNFGFQPSMAEYAVYTALTLYATHMQGKNQSMSIKGRSFALGARMMMSKTNPEGVKRRFASIITSSDVNELAHHIRGLVQMMRQTDIEFDYPAFARDLYYFQHPNKTRDVLLKWGQDFYIMAEDKNENSEE